MALTPRPHAAVVQSSVGTPRALRGHPLGLSHTPRGGSSGARSTRWRAQCEAADHQTVNCLTTTKVENTHGVTAMNVGDAQMESQARQFCGACEAGVQHDDCSRGEDRA